MKETINQRLKYLVEIGEIVPPELYNKIGASRTTWSGWVNAGRSIPLAKVQQILINCPDINARWLLTGEKSVHENNQDKKIKTDEKSTTYDPNCPFCQEKNKLIKILEYTLSVQRKLINQKKEKGKSKGEKEN